MTPQELVQTARAKLIARQPFYGTLIHKLPVEWTETITQTAATNGKKLIFNPAFVAALPPEQVITVIAHEILHAALLHPHRLQGRNPRLANIAADYVVNLILKLGGFTLPAGVLLDRKHHGKSFEQVYAELAAQQQKPEPEENDDEEEQEQEQDDDEQEEQEEENDDQEQDDDEEEQDDDGEPTPGEAEDAQDGDGENDGEQPEQQTGEQDDDNIADTTEPNADKPQPQDFGQIIPPPLDCDPGEMEQATVQAAILAKAAGLLPGELAGLIGELTEARLDWREELARFAENHGGRMDYSYRRPSRRSPDDVYLPGLNAGGEPGRLLIVLDTSGSCHAYLTDFVSECQGILAEFPNIAADVIGCDTDVEGPYPIDDVPTTKFHAYGGTAFQPALDFADTDGGYRGVIYLTDGYNYDPTGPLHCETDVLWVCTTERYKPEIGESVHIDLAAMNTY